MRRSGGDLVTKADLRALEQRLTIRFGDMLVVAVGIILAVLPYFPPHPEPQRSRLGCAALAKATQCRRSRSTLVHLSRGPNAWNEPCRSAGGALRS
jgi:hypothetical protein